MSANLFEFDHVSCILLVYTYNKWPLGYRSLKIKNVVSNHGENVEIFLRFWTVEKLEAENGTPFVRAEFREFCAGSNVKQVTEGFETLFVEIFIQKRRKKKKVKKNWSRLEEKDYKVKM